MPIYADTEILLYFAIMWKISLAAEGKQMLSKKVIASKPIHTRPAADLVKLAKEADIEITLKANNKEVNGKSIIKILSLGIMKDSEVEIVINGKNENTVIEQLAHVITN